MSIIEDMELTPQFKKWADECSTLFGGLEILGLDILHSVEDDRFYILELNDTAIGLVHKYEAEDMTFMRDVVIMRMEEAFLLPNDKTQTTENTQDEIKRLQEEVKQLKVQCGIEKERNKELQSRLKLAYESDKSFFSKLFK